VIADALPRVFINPSIVPSLSDFIPYSIDSPQPLPTFRASQDLSSSSKVIPSLTKTTPKDSSGRVSPTNLTPLLSLLQPWPEARPRSPNPMPQAITTPLAPSMTNTTGIQPTRKTKPLQQSYKHHQTTVQQRLCSLWCLMTPPSGLDPWDYPSTIPTTRTLSWQPHSGLNPPSCTTYLVETASATPTSPHT